MNKIIKRLFTPLAVFALVFGTMVTINSQREVVGANAATNSTTALTAHTELVAGKKYVIASFTGSKYYVLKASGLTLDNSKKAAGIDAGGTVSADWVTTYGAWSFAGTSGAFTLYSETDAKFLSHSGGSNTDLSYVAANPTSKFSASTSSTTNNKIRLTDDGQTSRGLLYRTSTFNVFGGYSTSGAASESEYFDLSFFLVEEILPPTVSIQSGVNELNFMLNDGNKTLNSTNNLDSPTIAWSIESGTSIEISGSSNGSSLTINPVSLGTSIVKIVVTKGEQTASDTITINIIDFGASSISVTNKTTEFRVGNVFTVGQSAVVTATMLDGTTRPLTNADYQVTLGGVQINVGYTLVAGDNGKSVVVSYAGANANAYSITVTQIVASISLDLSAAKTTFYFGETFSSNGVKVFTRNSNNIVIEEVTQFASISVGDTKKLGLSDIYVSYASVDGNFSTTYEITVTNEGAVIGEPSIVQGSTSSFTAADGKIVGFTDTGSAKYTDGSVKFDASGENITNNSIWTGSNSIGMTQISVLINIKVNNSVDSSDNEFTINAIDNQGTVIASTTQKKAFGLAYIDHTFVITIPANSNISGLSLIYTTKKAGNIGLKTISATPTYSSNPVLEQATAFANYVMTGIGSEGFGQCETVLTALQTEYNFMVEDAQLEFETNPDALFVSARDRMEYLETWVSAHSRGSGRIETSVESSSTVMATFIIGLIGISSLVGFYFVTKKSKFQ